MRFYGQHIRRLWSDVIWSSGEDSSSTNQQVWSSVLASVPTGSLLPNLEAISWLLAGIHKEGSVAIGWMGLLIPSVLRDFQLSVPVAINQAQALSFTKDVISRCPSLKVLRLQTPHTTTRNPEFWDFLIELSPPRSLELVRLNPQPLSNRALTWVGQLPQLNDLDIGLPEAPAISFPGGSFRRLAKLRVICRSIGSLKGFWITPMVSNLTRAEVILAVYSTNSQEIGPLFSIVAEHSPHLRKFSAEFGCIVPLSTVLDLRPLSLQKLTIRSPKLRIDNYAVLPSIGELWPSLESLHLTCEIETSDLLRVSIYLPKLKVLNVALPAPPKLDRVDRTQSFSASIESRRAVWQSHSLTLTIPHRYLTRCQGNDLDTLSK